MQMETETYQPRHHIRVITATSLFDGHDASINIMRRILQNTGAEIIHLGHNRSVMEIVDAALEEDVQGIALSSYQGGHVEFFKYMIDLLRAKGIPHVKVFGGGGGVIVPEEIQELEKYGVTKIYSPEDGSTMGLQGMINHLMKEIDFSTVSEARVSLKDLSVHDKKGVAAMITYLEEAGKQGADSSQEIVSRLHEKAQEKKVPVIGITGTGGAGKSSLTDEIILRFLNDVGDKTVAVISTDPSRRKTGGALLGDRIRMNSLSSPRVYMRSLATRKSHLAISEALKDAIDVVKAAGFDLVIAETAGIGQGDSEIFDLADVSVYVMTSEFGAATQLEKIDMLDFADLIVVNKYEKQGSEDALRDVCKQVQRNRSAFDKPPDAMPVFGTIASKFNDDGVTAFYCSLLDSIREKTGIHFESTVKRPALKKSSSKTVIIPPERTRYLSEISETVRAYHGETKKQADALRHIWHLEETLNSLEKEESGGMEVLLSKLRAEVKVAKSALSPETADLASQWKTLRNAYTRDELVYHVKDREIRVPLYTESLSHSRIPKIAVPRFKDPGEIYRWQREENFPGHFPFTAGVFPMKRVDEDPTRMFAGEGDPKRTNTRFRLLSGDYAAKRLSTAFDSVTLYGCDPEERLDIYGKIGTSGVSVCTLEDIKILYDGFDLCAPNTSVSMTINGPAPIILAMFFNAAIDQQVAAYEKETGVTPTGETYEAIRKKVFVNLRGTVQADILKEDQGQNTCIFSIEFALKMMADIQRFLTDHAIRNFYSVSISGYHIAEAGANPISQLAFTLSNGFTYVEYYLAKGMAIDTFAPNLSFFFSNGMDPEYNVLGRVARRIWAVAMREKYGASKRSQMLKYHIQTSGRSLHSREVQFNDIRTTLQALCGIYDNCNSLHTNAYDEAITTPSEESVRRALAIQMIINREWGLAKNENMNQGSFIIEELTRLVEEAVLMEFDRITSRGGVLGAMETGYQRSKIQEESLYYEHRKHSGEYPIIGVNTFINPNKSLEEEAGRLELARATSEEKDSQIERLRAFQEKHKDQSQAALKKLKAVALSDGNIFEELMETVRVCSLGQITKALYEVGGQFRRNM